MAYLDRTTSKWRAGFKPSMCKERATVACACKVSRSNMLEIVCIAPNNEEQESCVLSAWQSVHDYEIALQCGGLKKRLGKSCSRRRVKHGSGSDRRKSNRLDAHLPMLALRSAVTHTSNWPPVKNERQVVSVSFFVVFRSLWWG